MSSVSSVSQSAGSPGVGFEVTPGWGHVLVSAVSVPAHRQQPMARVVTAEDKGSPQRHFQRLQWEKRSRKPGRPLAG